MNLANDAYISFYFFAGTGKYISMKKLFCLSTIRVIVIVTQQEKLRIYKTREGRKWDGGSGGVIQYYMLVKQIV